MDFRLLVPVEVWTDGERIARFEALLRTYSEALAMGKDAVRQSTSINDEIGAAHVLDRLGFIYLETGRATSAVERLEESLELFRKLQKAREATMVLERLGDAHTAAGDETAARRNWLEALATLDRLGHPDAALLRSKLDLVTG